MPRTGTFGGFDFDPEVFTDYMAEQPTWKNAIIQSGILVQDNSIVQAIGTKGNVGTMPFYTPLDIEDNTFNRINDEILQEYSIKIQNSCCAVAEFLNDIDTYNASTSNNSDNRQISSKTVGSISVTYASKVSYIESYINDTSKIDTHIYELVSRYLVDTGLMNGCIKKARFKR